MIEQLHTDYMQSRLGARVTKPKADRRCRLEVGACVMKIAGDTRYNASERLECNCSD
jgi:hypothetical protein